MKCSSYDYVMEMTWREFQLRREAYLRTQKANLEHTRLLSYYSLVATGAIDTKKMSIEKFMPLDTNTKKATISKVNQSKVAQMQREILKLNTQ